MSKTEKDKRSKTVWLRLAVDALADVDALAAADRRKRADMLRCLVLDAVKARKGGKP